MKRKITIAVAVMLVLVMALSSCGAKGTKIDKILNADYNISADVYGEAKNVSELDGYTVDDSQNSDYFLVFKKADIQTGSITTKVMSLYTGDVISTFTTNDTAIYTLELFSDLPVFLVTNTPTGENAGDPSYTLYDADGESVATTSYKPEDPYMVGDDLVIYNYVGYSVSAEGELEKKMDIPEYVAVSRITDVNDLYYYTISSEGYVVYDFEFNEVSHWSAPSYVENASIFVLNNGDLFVQYVYALDEDATEFDVYDPDEGKKYELVTLVIAAKNAKAKEVKLDYFVAYLVPNYELYDAEDDNNEYTDKFENLAMIAPIVNKQIDTSETAIELVVLGNNGKIKSVLDYVEDLTEPGVKIGDNLYYVSSATANYIIDGNGNAIKILNNNSLNFVGGYAVGDVAIYDMDFEIVYNLVENDADVVGYVGDTIFVKENTDTGYEIISFAGGEEKTILTYNEDSTANDYFDVLGGDFYYIRNAASGEYTYYNADGDVVIKSTESLSIETAGEDLIVLSAEVDGSMKYYVTFVVTAE